MTPVSIVPDPLRGMVSVIIPCYQQGRFLPEAVKSLQQQTYWNWEAIVVNDGSRDETFNVIAGLCRQDSRVRYAAKPSGGVSSARNIGIALCRGEYVQLLDADDLLDCRKFEVQVGILDKCLDIDVVYGNAKYFRDGKFGDFSRGPYASSPEHDWIAELWDDTRPLLIKLTERNILPVCTPLLRRSVLNSVGRFNEELEALEDWEYWMRCAVASIRFLYVDAQGTDAFIRLHEASLSRNFQRILRSDCVMRNVFHKILPLGQARIENLSKLLQISFKLDGEGHYKRCEEIITGCRGNEEMLLAKMSMTAGSFIKKYKFATFLSEKKLSVIHEKAVLLARRVASITK